MGTRINNTVLAIAERSYALAPQRCPGTEALAHVRIISHRGEHGKRGVAENTFAAVDPLVASGVCGVEFDLRWTRDLEPVICHDPNLRRVFGIPLQLAEIPYKTLRAQCPAVPHLDEFVQRYAQNLHLMLEIKSETYPAPDQQQARLQQCLSGLRPGTDFHLLALETELFGYAAGLPAACWLPVARLNTRAMSAFALHHGCAGVGGPFMGLGTDLIAQHHQHGQIAAVGFPATRRLLYREINRGVDWLFSNHALGLQHHLDAARASG